MASITVTGNVTADPEIRFTQAGKAVASFSVAENHRKKQGDQWIDDGATFYRVSAWDDFAENLTEQIRKGSRVIVTGQIRNKPFESRDGSGKRDSWEVTADQVAVTVPKFKPREGGFSNGGAYG